MYFPHGCLASYFKTLHAPDKIYLSVHKKPIFTVFVLWKMNISSLKGISKPQKLFFETWILFSVLFLYFSKYT